MAQLKIPKNEAEKQALIKRLKQNKHVPKNYDGTAPRTKVKRGNKKK